MEVFINNNLISKVINGSIDITKRTNGERSCSVSIFDVNPFVKDGDELEIFDGPDKLFGGTINSVNYNLMTPITNAQPIIQMDITSDGYNFIPTRRVVNVSRTNTTAGQIVISMLTPELLGADTIFQNTVQSGAPITSYNVVGKTIANVLDDMAAASGFIWYIDDARGLHFKSGDVVTNSFKNLIYNGTFIDYRSLSWSTSFDNYANKVTVYGDNVSAAVQDTDEINERSQEAGGSSSGVYGFVIEDTNIKTAQQATVVGNNHLAKYAIRQSKLSFESYTKGWQPGTKLQVQIPQITGYNTATPPVPRNWFYLIEEVGIRREPGGLNVYKISATRRKDNNFNTQKSDGFIEFFKELTK